MPFVILSSAASLIKQIGANTWLNRAHEVSVIRRKTGFS